LSQLDKRNIGFVELAEVRVQVNNPHLNLHPKQPKEQIEEVAKTLRPFFFGVIVGNNGYTPESGLQQINASVIDAVTFGRYYICNPDLAERIIAGV
jgi:2,4-dienoyl-CoA reductase-like NADH-dependent reductase (Old Yellow Enzyme family)